MKPGPHFWTLCFRGPSGRYSSLSGGQFWSSGTPGRQLVALTVLYLRQLGTHDRKTAQMPA